MTSNAQATNDLEVAQETRSTFGPRLLTDDLQPMFGARFDQKLTERVSMNITAGATADWGAQVDGGTFTVGADLHPFGGGLTGLWMGPRVTANLREKSTQINGKLLWGYSFALKPGLLLGAGVGPGVQFNMTDNTSAIMPAGEVIAGFSF
jgi:hypothetical protein